MKKKTIIILSFIVTQLSFSQLNRTDFNTVVTSEIEDVFFKSNFIGPYEDEKGNIGAIRYFDQNIPKGSKNRIKGVSIQKWNNKGEVIFDKVHMLPFEKKGIQGGLLVQNSSFSALELVPDNKAKTLNYFVHEFNEKEVKNKRQILTVKTDNVKRKLTFTNDYRYDSNYFGSFKLSENNEFISYVIDLGKDKNEAEKHLIVLFDVNFNVLWQKEFTYNTKDALFHFSEQQVTNSGDVLIKAKIYNNVVKEKKKGTLNYRYELFKISKEKEVSSVLNTSNSFVSDLHFVQNDTSIDCIGFYADELSKIEGTLFFQLNNDLSVKTIKKQKLQNATFIEKYGNLLKNKFPKYTIREVKQLESGEYIIVAEDFFISYTNLNSMNISTETYHYKDVLVVLLNKDGELKWSRNISRDLSGNKEGYFSISSIISNNSQICFLTNAHKELGTSKTNQLRLKSNLLIGNLTYNTNLYGVVFNKENGEYFIQKVLSNKDTGTMFSVLKSKQIDSNRIVMWEQKRKKGQFLTVELK